MTYSMLPFSLLVVLQHPHNIHPVQRNVLSLTKTQRRETETSEWFNKRDPYRGFLFHATTGGLEVYLSSLLLLDGRGRCSTWTDSERQEGLKKQMYPDHVSRRNLFPWPVLFTAVALSLCLSLSRPHQIIAVHAEGIYHNCTSHGWCVALTHHNVNVIADPKPQHRNIPKL